MIKLYKLSIYIISLFSLIITLIFNHSFVTNLPLLPLIYLLMNIIYRDFLNKSLEYKSLFIINSIILIRYTIIPILYSFDSITLFRNIPSIDILNKSIIIMVYELVVTIITIEILTKKKLEKNYRIKCENNLAGFLFLLFTIFIITLNPKLLERYSFVLTTDILKPKYIEGIENSVQLLFVQLGHLVLIATIIHISYKYLSKKSEFLGLLIGIVLSSLISMFIVGTSRSSVVLPLATSLLLLGDIFLKYKKKIYLLSGGFIVFIILLTTKLKSDTINSNISSSTLENIHYQLQVYFSGFMNVAYSLDSRNLYSSFEINSILADTFRSVAYFGSLLQAKISAFDAYNIRIYNGGLERDQILPMIGQGYLYFGAILSPIFIIITLILVIQLEKKYLKSSSIFIKFALLLCIIKFSLYQMSNFTIIISFATNIVLPMLFIAVINKLFGRKKNDEN